MNFLPYKYFIYFNYFLCATIVGTPYLFSSDTSANFVLSAVGLGLFFVQASSKSMPFPKTEFLPIKVVILITFLAAILLTFLPQLLNLTTKTNLLFVIFGVAFLQLLSLFFTKIEIEEIKTDKITKSE